MEDFNIVDAAEWVDYCSGYETHLLQTAAWGELKNQFGWSVKRVISGAFGAQILFKPLPFGYSVGYIPKISAGMFDRMIEPEVLTQVDRLCHMNKAVFLKVEVDIWQDTVLDVYPPTGFRNSKHSIQPPNTIIVDISDDEQGILGRMKQKFRYNIKLATKKGVTIERSEDVAAFYEIMRETGGRDGFHVHSLDYYQKAFALFKQTDDVALLIAKFEGTPIAGVMAFASGKRAYYLYGASSNAERNRMPANLTQWEAVTWAREKGCVEYDLWGIPDANEAELEANFENRSDDLWGVYRFKRGFGGKVRRSMDTIDRVYKPFLYRFYLARQRLRGIPE